MGPEVQFMRAANRKSICTMRAPKKHRGLENGCEGQIARHCICGVGGYGSGRARFVRQEGRGQGREGGRKGGGRCEGKGRGGCEGSRSAGEGRRSARSRDRRLHV